MRPSEGSCLRKRALFVSRALCSRGERRGPIFEKKKRGASFEIRIHARHDVIVWEIHLDLMLPKRDRFFPKHATNVGIPIRELSIYIHPRVLKKKKMRGRESQAVVDGVRAVEPRRRETARISICVRYTERGLWQTSRARAASREREEA